MKAQVPKYKEVVEWVLENINNGTFPMGGKLPSENELSARFNLSRQTIRHAIEVLEKQELVTRVQGSGTYVGESLKVKRTESYKNIAVISTYVDSYIFPPVLKGIERVLSKEGYTMQLAFTGNRIERESNILDHILEKGMIDGLIVESAKSALPNPNLHYYRKLMEQGIPILFFNSCYKELNLPLVALDDVQAGQKAAEYLIQNGHTSIGGIFKSDDGQGALRYTGYLRALQNAGLKLNSKIVFWLDTDDLETPEAWEDYLFLRMEGCTAISCYNDEVAYLIAGICQKRGIKIPEQLSLIGIDNSELAVFGETKITSLPHPVEALGRKAAKNMIKLIENPNFDANYMFDSEVIERESVKKITAQEERV